MSKDKSYKYLHNRIFDNEISLTGMSTKNGVKIGEALIPLISKDGVKGDLVLYKGVYNMNGINMNVVLKITENEDDI